VNCMPVFIASNPKWERRFREKNLPIIGDDVKAQLGATIVHRVLSSLFRTRGVSYNRTYQLNTGGNTDFMNMLDRARLERAFDATHTTSPAGSILASIDAARALLARDGERLSGRLLRGLAAARKRLREVPGLDVLDGPGVDPAKLVVLLAGTGAHGGLVEADLIDAGMPVEMGDRDTVVPIVTMADDEEQIATFTEELIAAVERHRGQPRRPVATAAWTVRPQPVLAPREAFFALNETVPASSAVGRISAELVAPYPPGVPVLAPGELITAEALAALREVAGYGGRIAYAEDPSLATFQVVA